MSASARNTRLQGSGFASGLDFPAAEVMLRGAFASERFIRGPPVTRMRRYILLGTIALVVVILAVPSSIRVLTDWWWFREILLF